MIKKMTLLCLVLQFFTFNINTLIKSDSNDLNAQIIPEISKMKLSEKKIKADSNKKSWQKDRERKNRISPGIGFFVNWDNNEGITLEYMRDIKNGFYADFGIGFYNLVYEAEFKGFYDLVYSSDIIGILPGAGFAFTGFNSDGLSVYPLFLLKIDLHISDLNSLGAEYKGILKSGNNDSDLNSFLSINLGFKF